MPQADEAKKRRDAAAMPRELRVVSVGARGDGVLDTPHGQMHVPFALPGEQVAVEPGSGPPRLVRVGEAGPDRVAPICRYFGECGGCKLQHWRSEPYLAWKRRLVIDALVSQGFEQEVERVVAVTIDAHGAGRRRVTFHARREENAMRTGFMREGSHELIAIEACPILAPPLAASPRAASHVAETLARAAKPLDIAITATEAGLDISVKGHGPFAPSDRARITRLAERLDLARFANHNETIVERRPPIIMIAGCRVLPPPGAFLQATALGEETLARLACEALAGRRRIADLFCGVGPFALSLARTAQIRAYDGDAAAIAALSRAARETQGSKPIAAEARDLFRRPLLPSELQNCDAVLLDPPRQGALAQARELARSRLGRIVYVSCNPSTFARDAALLVAGGYRLEAVTPVDQFRYSAHLELVGVFERAK
jgi:23S rRNA (uracil1939-C5)-methyltransferase